MSLIKNFEIYIDSFLPYEYKIAKISPFLAQKRTQALCALTIQVFSSMAGFSFFFFRRVSK